MDEPQFIKTPNGDDLVVLTKADYEELIRIAEEAAEDAADVAAYDAAKAASANAKPVPREVSRLVQKGDTILKAVRVWRDIGQVKLADDIGSSQGFISDLENRRRKLTPEVAEKLAVALDVPLDWLI
ncbi:MAG TPA: helix-turn-helix transcriptional regulator [Devosia sp.]|jgi:ribosome-binding protein aMBF1 (putative translation factor)